MAKARLRALLFPDDDVWPSRAVSERGLLGLATGTYSSVLPNGVARAASGSIGEAAAADLEEAHEAMSTAGRSVAKSKEGRAAARAAATAIASQVRACVCVCGTRPLASQRCGGAGGGVRTPHACAAAV